MEHTWTFFALFGRATTGLSPILLFLIGVIITNGVIIGRLEGWKLGDGLYHVFINATTVGYGDLHPTRGLTKALAVLNAFVGLLFTGLVVGVGVFAVEKTYNIPL